MISISGNNGGAYTRSDIELKFASWLFPKFKLYVIQEFQVLKKNESYQNKIFGMTAKEWKEGNLNLAEDGNIRDYTDLLHLVILSNLENINAELIETGISQSDRLNRLNDIAKKQIELLRKNKSLKNLEYIENKINDNLLIDTKRSDL